MKRILLNSSIFLIVFVEVNLMAQSKMTIEGRIVDKDTQKPLQYVNIKVENSMRGTVSNIDGKFNLVLDSSSYGLRFSILGYDHQTIAVDRSVSSLKIELDPKPIPFNAVFIYPHPYTWEERFILRAIDQKKRFKEKLRYYTALAYSKSSFFSAKSDHLFAMIEAVSDVAYQTPDLYKETVLSMHIPSYLKNIPYPAISVNQEVDLYNENIKVKSFSMMSPLNDQALESYSYRMNRQVLSGQDTLVQIDVQPRYSRKPLLEGELFFNKKTYHLIEARLNGNASVNDGNADSLSLLINYKTDTLFVLPAYVKVKMRMNFLGYGYRYVQEYTFANHSVNDLSSKPYIDINRLVSIEPNLTYDVDLKREAMFRTPLSERELNYQEVVNRVFDKAPLHRRIELFLICDLMPLAYDRPASVGKVRINRLSHWYRFNKTEGHYLGAEYQFLNRATTHLYAWGGYSFGQKAGSFHVMGRYKGLESQIENRIVNLGRFDYNQTSSTLSALFSHRDELHYYHSTRYALSHTVDLLHDFKAAAGIQLEEQRPVGIATSFSLAGRDRSYAPNYSIKRYNNHKMGIELNYLQNKDIVNNRPILYRGKSFFNISFKYDRQNKSALKATENRSIYHLKFQRFQSIANPVAADVKCIWHKQDRTDYLQEMNFTNRWATVLECENDLEFYSLNHYEYYFGDYFKLQGDVNLFNFPKIYMLRMVLGSVFSYLKPAAAHDLHQDPFHLLSHPFWEYGIVIKGISICNFYIVKNNLHENKLHYLFRVSF